MSRGGSWRLNARESVRQAFAGIAVLLVLGGLALATPWARPFAGRADQQLALVLRSFEDSKTGLARRCDALRASGRTGPLGFDLTGLASPMALDNRDPMTVEARVSAAEPGRYTLRYLLPEIRGRGF